MGGAISEIEDESYLQLAIETWLLSDEKPSKPSPLDRLAHSLQQNHDDIWMVDFLGSPPSSTADKFLVKAISSNYTANYPDALSASELSARMYRRMGNQAGALRSQFEQVYALRRLSASDQCLQLAPLVIGSASRLHYRWIEIQSIIEQSSCHGMRSDADSARILAEDAARKAETAKYQILYLRALGLRGNLDAFEGRSDASWANNEEGLSRFWQGYFPDERAFQLYYNLQVDAEKNGAIYLALILQRETLEMIAKKSRFDFEAMAHFRMAGAAQTVGDTRTARRELELYKELITRIENPKARSLYEAYCEVGLARLSLNSGSIEDAKHHLTQAAPVISHTDNVLLRLEALTTSAEFERLTNNTEDEQKELRQITAIAKNGFESLKSVTDRWRWRRIVEDAYRRLLEIEISSPHSPTHALVYWEFFHQLESSPSSPVIPAAAAELPPLTQAQLAEFRDKSFVSYAVLSSTVVVWLVDDSGIREFHLPVKPEELRIESLRFYSLCSDPHSAMEKVNASGSRLHEWLVAPIEGALSKDREIRVEPDGFLGLLPWAALRMSDGSYWGSNHVVVISPGLFEGHSKTAKNRPVQNVTVAIPNSLRLNGQDYLQPINVNQEAAELATLYPGLKELRGGAVNVANIVKELPHADIFEFAGHAVTREHGGELVVQGENGAEMLSGAKLATLRLEKTRLVVLSACSTGSGRDADHDPNGLVRSLLNAGADSVLATRWDVDSAATAKGMEQFYRSYKAGKTKSQALQAAREELRAEDEFQHPYYWAGIEIFSAN